MSFLFEELRVYQKSMGFAEEILRAVDKAPKNCAKLADQLRRAAMSIPTNLAEGCGRWHKADRKQFFWVARGSTNECVTHLQFALNRGMIPPSDYPRLRRDLDVIGKMITALISAQKNGEQRK